MSWGKHGLGSQAGFSHWFCEDLGDKQLLLLACVRVWHIPSPSSAAESLALPCADTKKTSKEARLAFPSNLLSQATAVLPMPRAVLRLPEIHLKRWIFDYVASENI